MEENNTIKRHHGGRIGATESCGGVGLGQDAEGLTPGFLLGHPFSRAFQALHHPINDGGINHLHPCYPQPANYFCMAIEAPGQTGREETSTTTWVCGDCSVFEGGWHPQNNGQLPLGEDIHTKPLGWSHHYDDDVHAIVARCQVRHHLYWLTDSLYESCQLEFSTHGSWLP